jgi:hypothetical protein
VDHDVYNPHTQRFERGKPEPKNRCVETMTKMEFHHHLYVRVWSNCEQPDRALANFMGPDEKVVAVINSVLEVRLRSLTELLEYLRDELENLDHVAAYEIVDSEGQGVVVYPDWK